MNIERLLREFPEYEIDRLKAGSPQFADLFADYRRINREVERAEEHDLPLSDVTFENLKKRRLRLKDELYAMLLRKT